MTTVTYMTTTNPQVNAEAQAARLICNFPFPGEREAGNSRCARKWGQISNAYISETAGRNLAYMVCKSLEFLALSNGIGLEALRGRIRKLVILSQDMGCSRRSWIGNSRRPSLGCLGSG